MDAREAAIRYTEAKSRGEVDSALEVCDGDFTLLGVGFNMIARGRENARRQLNDFYGIFPDYGGIIDGVLSTDDTVTMWGQASATMAGDLGTVTATHRHFTVPFSCIFTAANGLLLHETLHLDLHAICSQLGVSTDEVAGQLALARSIYDGSSQIPLTSS